MGTRLTLVVGATGQPGAAVAGCLAPGGHGTRALVRPGSRRDHLPADGVELVEGDLRDRDSLLRACRDADTVIATANAVVPRSRSDVRAIDAGYEALISAAEREGVRRFVHISVPVSAINAEVGVGRSRDVERDPLTPASPLGRRPRRHLAGPVAPWSAPIGGRSMRRRPAEPRVHRSSELVAKPVLETS